MLPNLAIIVAKASNNVIGADNEIPWYLPNDLKRFKALTMGSPIIMGRKTWDSLPRKPLPGRAHFVVSKTPQAKKIENVFWYTAPDTAMSAALAWAKSRAITSVFVIGGSSVYAAALPFATVLYMTELDLEVGGDVYFPEIDRDKWRVAHTETILQEADPKAPCDYSFVTYHPAPSHTPETLLQIL